MRRSSPEKMLCKSHALFLPYDPDSSILIIWVPVYPAVQRKTGVFWMDYCLINVIFVQIVLFRLITTIYLIQMADHYLDHCQIVNT